VRYRITGVIPAALIEEFVDRPLNDGLWEVEQDPSEEKHLRPIIPGCTGVCTPCANLARMARLTHGTKPFSWVRLT
jgi:hypothetical protein